VVSGAGPTVLVLARNADEVERAGTLVPPGWRTETPGVAARGARVVARRR
jgi:homoserine kinase